jgi:exodeoxyribonuclease VII large subunit
LSDPRFVIAQHQQGLDEHRLRAERAIGRHLARGSARLEGLERRLLARHPRVLVLGSRSRSEPLAARLHLALSRRLERERHTLARFPAQLRGALLTQLRREQSQLATLRGQLSALSPLTVLSRGYSIVSTESGRVLTSSSAVAPGDAQRIRLAEGRLAARVEERDEEAR